MPCLAMADMSALAEANVPALAAAEVPGEKSDDTEKREVSSMLISFSSFLSLSFFFRQFFLKMRLFILYLANTLASI